MLQLRLGSLESPQRNRESPCFVVSSVDVTMSMPFVGRTVTGDLGKLEALIEEAVFDAYGDEEQTGGLFTMIEEHLALPFSVSILGVEAVVEKVDLTRDGRIVAVCRHDGGKQRIEILDLPLPQPTPAGAEWIAAYSHWCRGL
jgi:hypothetical protein